MGTKRASATTGLIRTGAEVAPMLAAASDVLRTIGDNRIGERRVQVDGIQNLVVAGGATMARAAGSVVGALEGAFERRDDARQQRLVDSVRAIGAVDMPREQVGPAIRLALESQRESAARQDEAIGDTARILSAGASATVVVLAAAVGWQYARPRTFWERITNLWS